MKIHFLGANRQVTGSRYCLETEHSRVMVDCGMFQERPFLVRNWATSPVPPESVQAMLLTHAHVDHCGLIPRFVRQGFNAPIYATAATIELADIILRDAAKIQAEDVAYKRRRHEKEGRRGPYPEQPLFDDSDVDETLSLFEPVRYRQKVQVSEDISATFHDAGHILGSAMLQVEAGQGERKRQIVFSGDIGQWNRPLMHDPSVFHSADYVVMESTYGDRDHKQAADIETQLEQVINSTVKAGGNVVIPTFAVERAQELMFYFSQLVHDRRIPKMRVFLDSPMAVDVTEVFRRHRDRLDPETWNAINAGSKPLRFPGLTLCRSVQQSKAINQERHPCVIMATSGMCDAGRIKHHLKHNLPRPDSTILFVGYQAHGTLGRKILDRVPEVRIHGRTWPVRARVEQIYGFSGHTDRSGLLYWVDQFNERQPRRLFLTHGDQEAAENLAAEIRLRHEWDVLIPEYESTSDIR